MQTRVTDLLGIEYPIIQGGMAWVATTPLVVAVSEAGGLGIIGAGGMSASQLQTEIRQVRSATDKPFGVNLMLLSPCIEEQIRVVKEEKVPVVTTGAGNPGSLVEDLSSLGIMVIPVVASVALAKRLLRYGVKMFIAEGMEAGGHIGEVTTMCLIPQMVDAVSVPVIAAGGVADGRGMAACFVLGAEGVQLGTRFVCTEECDVHPAYKEALLKAQDRSTVVTGTSTGHPVRCLQNKLSRQFTQLERRGVSREELEALGSGKLQAAVCGDVSEGSVMAGQISGLIRDIKPVKAVIEEIMKDFQTTVSRLTKMVSEKWD
ncbi:MAG: enoyl-[acyl-carrier protein] reductase [Candidatus Atribacteria bacterium]|nr:enoyl-[acyl-carrier protein] reductase [Candidatus Atribacteria bacterium]